jgi:hypothetical protein
MNTSRDLDEVLTIRLTPQVKSELVRRARADDRPVGVYARRVLMAALQQEKERTHAET